MRRLWVLIAGIPPDGSALARACGQRVGWGNTEELLKVLCELVDAGNRSFHRAHTKRGAQQPKPLELIRPWEVTEDKATGKRKRPATSRELKAFFGGGARYVAPGTDGEDVVDVVGVEPLPDARPAARPRCPGGHFVRPGRPCSCGR